jgi:CDP-6-deoxy-D-xylo-4-hexulose-3-dehydrase
LYYENQGKNFRRPQLGKLDLRYGGIISGDEEIAAVTAVLKSQDWACGKITREFEDAIAAYMGLPHAVFVNSGSSGLLAALHCLPRGSTVAMPALQFPTLYSAALWCGLRPIVCDIDPDTLNMSMQTLLEACEGRRADAVAFVHIAGNPAGIAEIANFCHEENVLLIEDCCEALGSTSQGQKAGTFGDISVISTHGAHHITTSVGGVAFTSNGSYAQQMRRLRDWGRDIDFSGSYEFITCGLNLQPSDIQAALGLVQLSRADDFISARRRNHAALARELTGVVYFPEALPGDDPSWFTFPFLTTDRDSVAEELAAYGIETRHLLCGNLARQPMTEGLRPEDYPNADEAWRDGLWLPVHPRHSEEDMTRAGKIAREILIGGGA